MSTVLENNRTERPVNVLVILSDDQGPWALGCAGNQEIITPNLDQLAASGTRFSRFFCTSPVCSPARASLLTGMVPSQHGVHDWVRGGNSGPHAIGYLDGITTYSEILSRHGYSCALSGKWHLGDSLRPQAGFEHWFVQEHGSGHLRYYNLPMARDGAVAPAPGYITSVITDDAVETLDCLAASGSPWYLSVHYTAPHSPWLNEHPAEIAALYSDCHFFSCPDEPPHPWLETSGMPSSARFERRENLRGYFAAVTAMDREVGRIFDALDRHGLREQTLVWFLSDNGFNCGHHGIWGKGNGTFPANMFDSSVCVPAIVSRPGHVPAGAVCDELISGYDFAPTLLEYLGIDAGELGGGRPGHSQVHLLGAEPGSNRESVVVFDEYGPVRMIRTRQWKYVHRYPYGPHELYDMEEDPDERVNLAEPKESESRRVVGVLAEMRSELEKWFGEYVVPGLDGARQPVTGRGQLDRLGGDGMVHFQAR